MRRNVDTLYSAYGNTANVNMLPIAFAIVFGNEDKGKCWRRETMTNEDDNDARRREILEWGNDEDE